MVEDKTNALRDLYMLKFLELSEPYKEYDLKMAVLKNIIKFFLEFGRDFIFMGEEYHLQIGKTIFIKEKSSCYYF